MPAFLAPLLIGGGIAAAKGLAGVGLGYGASRVTNTGYDSRDAALDFSFGALLTPGSGRVASGIGRLAPRYADDALRLSRGPILRTGGPWRMGAGVGLPMLNVGMAPGGSAPASGGVAAPVRTAPNPVISSGGMTMSDGSFEPISVNPVSISFTPGKAPVFNKTLKDFLADKQLQGLVNQQIFQMNSPLLDANKQTKINRGRKTKQAQQLGASLQKHYDRVIAEDAAADAAEVERNTNRAAELRAQEQAALESVPITYMEGEAVTAKQQADVAEANEQSMADALIDRLAVQGQDYLKRLRDAEAAQDRVNVQSINQEAADAIRANAAQIRSNQAQRGNLLGTLASEQYKNAIDLYNTAINQFNQAEDRRYDQAARKAQMEYDAQVANAQLQVDEMSAIADAMEDSEPSADLKAARKRLDKMNDDITKHKGNEPDRDKQSYEWEQWSHKLLKMRQERDRIKNKYFPAPRMTGVRSR